jgi:hypothetical protein
LSSGFDSNWLLAFEARQFARGLARGPAPSHADELEADLQNAIAGYLDGLGKCCYYVWHRTDKASTCKKGTGDFVGWIGGKPFVIEVKRPGRKAEPEQAGELLRATLAGAKVTVAYSLQDAVTFIESIK